MARQKSAGTHLPVRKSPEALAMIRDERLERIVAAVEKAVRELHHSGVPINEVEIAREVDPEIENWVSLSVTVWMPAAAVDQASDAWNRLLESTRERAAELGPEETSKLSDLVSIGVDIDE